MKTQIESTIRWATNPEVTVEFNHLIDVCIYSPSEEILKREMERFKNEYLNYFTHGFGSNHMWVKQRMMGDRNKLYNERILFVEF